MEGFQYVVHKQKKPKVAFLSGQNRKLLYERRGFERIDCEMTTKPTNELPPGAYPGADKLTSAFSKTRDKVMSKLGISSLASKVTRLAKPPQSSTPAPNEYSIKDHFEVKKENRYPFNVTKTRHTQETTDVPGICTYDTTVHEKDYSIPFEHSFGGRTKLKPVIQMKCTPENRDVCRFCGEKPVGDYWVSNDKEEHAVCADCYENRKLYKIKSSDPNKPKYQKIRDCGLVHRHEGTTAALPLMSNKDFIKQTVRECYFAPYMATHVIKKKKPASNLGKTLPQNAEISGGDPDFLYKKMSKFIHNLYNETEAEYLQKRDITDERVRQILTPLSLVPDSETLMKYLINEQEPYKLREFPKKPKVPKKRFDVDKICETWEWKYKEVKFNRDDVVKQHQIPEEVLEKLRPAGRQPKLIAPPFKQQDKKDRAKPDIDDQLWQYFKKHEPDSDYEELPDVCEPLQYAVSVLPTQIKNHPIDELFLPQQPIPKDLPLVTDLKSIEEESKEIKTKGKWSELDLLQNPDIPPMPRPLRPGDEPMDTSNLDPDIATIFDGPSETYIDKRSLSALTIGSQTGYPHVEI